MSFRQIDARGIWAGERDANSHWRKCRGSPRWRDSLVHEQAEPLG